MATDSTQDLLHGTLDLLVLKTLSWGPRHGYAIARWLEDATSDALAIGEGSLYPALYRMERRGWIAASWGVSELGRRAKVYQLTPDGQAQLTRQTDEWAAFTRSVARVLLPGGALTVAPG